MLYMINSSEATIAAIATAVSAGQGGIAIVRISGPAAEQVGREILTFKGKQSWESHKICYGNVISKDGKEHLDEVLTFLMRSPRSFTGEDIVEIHCHGGHIAVQRVLDRVLEHPSVRRAMPGEFSQRAVINGRLNLTQAEAISELIAAKSNKAAQIAMAGIDGGIQNKINSLREVLIIQLSELEARVDFEEDLPPLKEKSVLDKIKKVRLELNELVRDSRRGKFIRQGIRIAITGLPNVGKSSLLNRVSRNNKAIVTDLPGTTRDVLESEIILKGVPVILIDTAGVREPKDKVEKIGIEKTHETIMNADLVIQVFDLSKGWGVKDQALLDLIPKDIKRIIVGNKVDLINDLDQEIFSPTSIHLNEMDLKFSAFSGEGEELLINKILCSCDSHDINSLLTALNERQSDLAKSASNSLTRTERVAEENLPWDFWTIDLREAVYKLGEITGEEVNEAVLDQIFSKFCIGK